MTSQPSQASDPGSTSTLKHIVGNSLDIETASSQSSIAKVQTRWKKLSLTGRKTADDHEETWGLFGLNLLYDPPEPLIDLIFVHGLRGGSIKTWCKGDDLKCFWPQAWLPKERDLQNVRIHSFGYNADWANMTETALDLHDFGRALLTEMNTSPFLRPPRESPVLLVGHSMGGLVIKKAYILAQKDPKHFALAQRIQCMFFLATPHRGSDSARLLNNILKASLFYSSRQYIVDIFKGSASLQVINDEFSAFADKLQLWSFYETLKTRTSPTSSVLIVERDSAVLGTVVTVPFLFCQLIGAAGYKGEMAQPLNADHRSICKFDSPTDPNYITIRNSISKAVEDLLGEALLKKTEETRSQIRNIETFLMISHSSEDDLNAAETDKTEGTCEWVLNLDSFRHWRDSSSEDSTFYWLTGEPGSGKTVLAAHIIRHLQSIGADVCYYFFHYGLKSHQSISEFLRQIAYQMSLHHMPVRQSLYKMQELGVSFDKDDERTIWRKFFTNEILNISQHAPQYWIVDGFDECIDAPKLFSLIAKFEAAFPIRFCFISRKRADLDIHFSRFAQRLSAHHIAVSQTQEDIGTYIRDNATVLLTADEEESGSLIDRIVSKSNGIFLWAKYALEELDKVYSDESIDNILDEMPEGLASIYQRILEMMATNTREIKLTKAILTWVVCGARSFSVDELQALLKLDLGMSIRSVERSVEGLCGQLLRIDKMGTVDVIHATIRGFLLDLGLESPLAIHEDQGHERLAVVCLKYLVSDELRPPRHRSLVQVQAGPTSVFADYACALFSEHVMKASAESNEIMSLLNRFFRTNVLTWIEFIARRKRDLFHVTRTARNLRQYLESRAKYTSPLDDQYRYIEQWTSDLIRIVTKFARNLINFPSTVFYLVPPLCPADSAIFREFKDSQNGYKLHGTSRTGWDDCISYIDYRGIRAMALAAGDDVFAIGQTTGHIRIYDAATCYEKAIITHGEPVKLLKFDNSSQRLLASGSNRLNMFHADGELLWTFEHYHIVVTAGFSVIDDTVTVITTTSSVVRFSASTGVVLPAGSLGKDDYRPLKVTPRQVILRADISPDLRLMAFLSRSGYVALWSLERDSYIGVCMFKGDTPGAARMPTSKVLFNPNPAVELLAVASEDGELAVFDPWTCQEIKSVSGEYTHAVACAPDGRVLATGTMRGDIKLWDFESLTLLYCINADDYGVGSLAFSGDGFRLYDTCASKTRVWEPSVLVRKSLSDESSISESIAQPATVVDRGQESIEIISIAAMGAEPLVLAGQKDGSVVLFDASTSKLQKTLYSHHHKLMITRVSWSAGGYVATADASSTVEVWAVSRGVSRGADNSIEATSKVMEVNIPSSIRGVALSPSGPKLLVCEASSDSIYWFPEAGIESFPKASIVSSQSDYRAWAWLPRPLAGFDILMVSESRLCLYQTNDTLKDISLKGMATLLWGGNPLLLSAHRLALTETSRFLAIELETTRGAAAPKLLVYDLEPLLYEVESRPDETPRTIQPLLCLHNKMVRAFLGWRNHILIFLDPDLWICSIDMASVRSGEKSSYTRRRYFFIPYELIGSNNGVAPILASESSIVFPCGGSLSIVEDALSSVFMDDEVVDDK
ncbi:hypothetical protein F4802DRAFT_620340 [Xylaria palmicola]|nr:hypothetical protein F4802DRAFT_620340 [Xylaria palmicola]